MVLWVILILITGLSLFSAFRLRFVEDIGSFLPNNREYKSIKEAYQHLGGDNKLVVSIAMADSTVNPDLDLLSSVADRVAEKLTEADTSGYIRSLRYQVDDQEVTAVMAYVLDNLPYFLADEDYLRMDTLLTPEHISSQLATDRQLLASPIPMMRSLIQSDPLFFSSGVLQSLNDFKLDDRYQTENDHIFNKEGTEAQVVVTSNYPLSETRCNGQLIQIIDRTMQEVAREQGGRVHISCFGASQVSLTNSSQIKKDSMMAIGLSLLLIIALLYYYYRNFRSILMILVSISFGALFALGLLSFMKNPVSVIAIGAASIIIGIAINYPIHFLSHFKRTDDKEQILNDIVNPLLIGNITTVGAFLSLLFISSDAMKDLGLFSALLLVGTILFVLVFLPHLTGRHSQGSNRDLAFRRVAEFRFEDVRGLFWIIVALTGVFCFFSPRASFDTDMHHINYMTKEQREAFAKLQSESDTAVQSVYAIAEGRTLDEALSSQDRLLRTLAQADSVYPSAVVRYSGVGCFFPSREVQRQRLDRWNAFWEGKREAFCADLDRAALQNGFNPEAFAPCKEAVLRTYTLQDSGFFQPLRASLASNYIVQTEDKTLVYNMLKVSEKDSDAFEEYFNRISGEGIFAFTDTSIASLLVNALSVDFNYVLYICGFIVLAFLLFSFGRVEICLMAFLPLFIAWIWILGIMGMAGIRFNIVNIILATFIFGMGDDYSIFVTEGLLYEHAYGRKMLAQFKNSIILSAAIMFVSIGMLIFAKHPAMRSLAEVTIIGMFSVVLMAYVVPPLVFKWLVSRKGHLRRKPVTLGSVIASLFSAFCYLIGLLVLIVGGFVLLGIGKRNDANKLRYHKLLQKLFQIIARIIPGASFTVSNPHAETFEKPAMIISNHQSSFDLMCLLMLHPKIIVLTKEWAWNSLLFRWVVRKADYLPASYGMGPNLPKIQRMVDKGYSILFFPEGTRSFDHSILRFHQGAFYLADQLGLDILPVVTHGIGDIYPKHDIFVHRGKAVISIKERIHPDSVEYRNGKSARETSRLFRRYYIQEFATLREQCETPAYLKETVFHNYIYKGKEVELQCRRKFQYIKTLCDLLEQFPKEGKLLYKHCGNGELSLMTALLRKRMDVTAYDADESSTLLASRCLSVPENLHYTSALPDESLYDFIIDEQTIIHTPNN